MRSSILHRLEVTILIVLAVLLSATAFGTAYASREQQTASSGTCTTMPCPPVSGDDDGDGIDDYTFVFKSGTYFRVVLTLRDSGSHVSDWGPPASCGKGECTVYVQVTCSTGDKCYVMYYLHSESHTYDGIPRDTTLFTIYANDKLFAQIDPALERGPVGGHVSSVNPLELLLPYVALCALATAGILVVAKRRPLTRVRESN